MCAHAAVYKPIEMRQEFDDYSLFDLTLLLFIYSIFCICHIDTKRHIANFVYLEFDVI